MKEGLCTKHGGNLGTRDCTECDRQARMPVSSVLPTKFHRTECSQCGQKFGPGDHGYSHCSDHSDLQPIIERDSHFGGNSYEASMLRDLLAKIHGDSGDYVAAHGLDKAIDDAEAILSALRTTPPQAGREDAQSVKAWAIVGPDGKIIPWTTSATEVAAWRELTGAPFQGSKDDAIKEGYRAEQVTISTASGAAREEG